MAKTLVNKHFDNISQIEKYSRELFHENEEYAKGEIIIVNDENPSLWVLNKNNTPTQISGTNNGGGSSDIDENIINDIISGYTAADAQLRTDFVAADSNLKSTLEAADADIKRDYITRINALDTAYKAKDTEISKALLETEKEILAHTVNGIAISENPVIDADALSVGNYSEMIITSPYENVTSLDTIQIAIKKVENMVIANALAFAAGLNDVNRRVGDNTPAELEEMLTAEATRSTNTDNTMSAEISQLKQKVDALSSISGEDLTQLVNTVNSLSTQVTALQNENTRLKNRLTALEQWIDSNEEGGNGSSELE